MKELCVLIPSYNEERTIGDIVRELKAKGLVAYVVDDGSVDQTAEIAQREGAVVVKHKRNLGKGASMREGFKHILKKGYEAVVVMDGDGQHLADDIDAFLDKMRKTDADIVVGNRMLDTSAMPTLRIYTNRFMSWLISKIVRQSVPDTQSGFRLIKREVLQKITLESSNYEIESEMIIKAARAGFVIESAPVKTVYQGEQSRINPLQDTFRFIIFLIRTLSRKAG